MARTWDANLDPKVAELVNAAFDKSWQFVKTDPELAHADLQEMRTRLGQNLARLAQNGERDLWRLANAAIGQLRRERSAAQGAIRRAPRPDLNTPHSITLLLRSEPGGKINPQPASPPPGA